MLMRIRQLQAALQVGKSVLGMHLQNEMYFPHKMPSIKTQKLLIEEKHEAHVTILETMFSLRVKASVHLTVLVTRKKILNSSMQV